MSTSVGYLFVGHMVTVLVRTNWIQQHTLSRQTLALERAANLTERLLLLSDLGGTQPTEQEAPSPEAGSSEVLSLSWHFLGQPSPSLLAHLQRWLQGALEGEDLKLRQRGPGGRLSITAPAGGHGRGMAGLLALARQMIATCEGLAASEGLGVELRPSLQLLRLDGETEGLGEGHTSLEPYLSAPADPRLRWLLVSHGVFERLDDDAMTAPALPPRTPMSEARGWHGGAHFLCLTPENLPEDPVHEEPHLAPA